MDENKNYPNWFMTDGMSNFISHLLKDYKDKPVKFLQIGAYTGDASVFMYEYILTDPNSSLVDVDTWEGSDEPVHRSWDWQDVEKVYDEKTKKGREEGKILKYKATSDHFFRHNTENYDFIYIDGDHTSYGVIKDAVNAYECLNLGGVIAFDDYEWSAGLGAQNEPKMAIDAFQSIYSDRVRLIIQEYQAWFRKVA
jgi:predicted O-methyltransferase YrrM